jgi:hypothetical protein
MSKQYGGNMDLFEGYTLFKDKNGVDNYFIKTVKNNIMVWKKGKHENYICGRLDLSAITENILVDADIWDKLPSKIKKIITVAQEKKKNEMRKRMAHARKNGERKPRESKYPGFPNTLKCSCGFTTPCVKDRFIKQVEKSGLTPQELADRYKCKECKKKEK